MKPDGQRRPDRSDPRQILVGIIHRAELEPAFRRELVADPNDVLKKHGISFEQVTALSNAFEDVRDIMSGCNDGTCWVSACPDSCYVTACGTTDCGETFPNGGWKQWGVDVEQGL